MVKPILKWVGGKTQLLPKIRKYYPFKENVCNYFEPFVGGGAVVLDILQHYHLGHVYISDANADLINLYQVVKDRPSELIGILQELQDEYWPLSFAERREFYNDRRDLFNDLDSTGAKNSLVKASLFIFLNKTCFNGLYRVNSKGRFNVPIGRYRQPLICDSENLVEVSSLLQGVTIKCADYRECLPEIDENSFVYLDPPYRPISATAAFTSYTSGEFGDEAQVELGNFVKEIDALNAKLLLSNSDPTNYDKTDNFFDELYSDFIINRVSAKRSINSKGNARGEISELLVANFQCVQVT